MIKYLFILINSLTLFVFGLFEGDAGVTLKSNFPSTITIGQEIPIELKISKGKMNGFARLQLDLPQGITVKEVENKGSTFTFEENSAKWVWVIVPEEEELVVKFVVLASEAAIGTRTVSAKYSYLEDNVKQVAEMLPVEFSVVTGTNDVTKNSSDTSVKVTEKNNLTSSSNSEPVGNITVSRTIVNGANPGEHIVNLIIKKGLTKGFARYSDDIVDGSLAKAIKLDGSSFSVADGKLKFVWVSVPEKDELEISYSLTDNQKGSTILNGEYSYLENNQSKKIALNQQILPSSLPVKDTLAINTEKKSETKPIEAIEPVKTPENEAKTTLVKNESATNFVIQIGAFTNGKVESKQLKQKFKINEPIKSEMQGGFIKFMVGSHVEYKNASYQRDVIKNVNGIKGAFVVAYNGAKRITVQEALMITNQKWYK